MGLVLVEGLDQFLTASLFLCHWHCYIQLRFLEWLLFGRTDVIHNFTDFPFPFLFGHFLLRLPLPSLNPYVLQLPLPIINPRFGNIEPIRIITNPQTLEPIRDLAYPSAFGQAIRQCILFLSALGLLSGRGSQLPRVEICCLGFYYDLPDLMA